MQLSLTSWDGSHLLNNVFIALHFRNWPSTHTHIPGRTLRSSNERTLKVPVLPEYSTPLIPSAARNSETFNVFKGKVRKFLDIIIITIIIIIIIKRFGFPSSVS